MSSREQLQELCKYACIYDRIIASILLASDNIVINER